jgi:predicted transposase YbfD/YdcC
VRRAARHPFFAQTTPGRGRVEVRQLAAFALEAAAVDFPFARSVIVVRSATTYKKSGETKTDTRYYLSSAEPADHTPARWQALVRGHWAGVEIRNHWRRDAVWGEDRSRTRKPVALGNLALLRNALFALLPEHYPGLSHPEIHERLHSHPAAALRLIRSP